MEALTNAVSPRLRRALLAVAIVFQSLVFFACLDRPLRIVNDNRLYEIPAARLVDGKGISLPYADFPDRAVHEWVCTRHPDACADGGYPTALYPPGYTFYIAAHYAVFGKRLWPIAATHWLLLVAFYFLAERLARAFTGRAGYVFTMGVLALYPFFGRQAAILQSDHPHLVVFAASLAAFTLMRPGPWRGAAFGLSMALATLLRPYTALTVPALFLFPAIWKERNATWREWFSAAAAFGAPSLAWAARNYYWFGRFIPFGTTGLGATLRSLVLEAEVGSVYGEEATAEYWKALFRYGSTAYYDANVQLTRESMVWIKAHPWKTLWVVLQHAPKTWISLGGDGESLGPKALVLGAYLGGLLLLGLMGMWMTRGVRRYWIFHVAILTYWVFLLQSPEARRSLPLRLPMFLFAAVVVDRVASRRKRDSA